MLVLDVGHGLVQMWGYKHDNKRNPAGITVHADDAAVNCNFWTTPDSANLSPEEGGGLRIYSSPDKSSSFEAINGARTLTLPLK